MAYTFTPYKLEGLLLIEGKFLPDERGSFQEAWRDDDFRAAGIPRFVQDNLSRSKRGVVRGLHYQKNPSAIGKLIRCMRGKIFDAAVDIRKGSPTFGKWASVELDGDSNRMLWVPAGFAHGFQAVSDTADVLYKVTGYWSQPDDRGVQWNDPDIGVPWPLADARHSPKDAGWPPLARADNNFSWR